MRKVVIRPRAIADLELIWLYTFETWNEVQATRYLRQVNESIQLLASTPERGKSRESVLPGYRSIHVGRHIVFYTHSDQSNGVERILHDQMDPTRHL